MANLFIGADLETFCNYWNLSEKMLMTSVNFRDSSHALYIRIHIALLLFNRIGLTSQRCIWICYVDSLTRQALINRVSKSDTEKNSANNTRVNSKYQFVENPRDYYFFWQLFIPCKLHTVDWEKGGSRLHDSVKLRLRRMLRQNLEMLTPFLYFSRTQH